MKVKLIGRNRRRSVGQFARLTLRARLAVERLVQLDPAALVACKLLLRSSASALG